MSLEQNQEQKRCLELAKKVKNYDKKPCSNTWGRAQDLKQDIEKNREVKAKAGLDKLNNKVNRNPSLTFDEFKALVQKGLI